MNSRYETVKRWESGARTYASRFETVFESGAGVRLGDEMQAKRNKMPVTSERG